MPKPYEIKAAHDGTPTVWIYGDIGPSWFDETVEAKTLVKEIAEIDAETIKVRIASYGGSVPDGIAIANALDSHPASIEYVIDSVAYSMAAYISSGPGRTTMASNALLMLHQPHGGAAGRADDMREMADVLDKWTEIYAQGIATKTGKTLDEIQALLSGGKDHYFNAEEALAFGLVDEITEPMQIAASLINSINEAGHKAPTGLKTMPKETEANTKPEVEAKKVETKKPAEAKPVEAKDVEAKAEVKAVKSTADILAADQSRRTEIRAKFEGFEQTPEILALRESCENDHKVTAQAAGIQLLEVLAKGQQPAQSVSRITVVDHSDEIRAASISAILCKAGKGTPEMRQEAIKAGYMGHTLLDFAKASLDRCGAVSAHMSKKEIVAAAFTYSGSDFPILLENTMHKALLGGYNVAADTWRRFCAVGSVSDFRAHNRYMRGSIGNLMGKTELNEYKNGSLGDGTKESITASTKGLIIGLSREMVVNDDLGAFVSIAADLGRSAARTIESDVYTALTSNSGLGPLLGDGKSLFHADHNNIGAGSAISVAAIDANRVIMASQQDNGGNDFLDLSPAVAVVPIGLGGSMREVNAQEYNDDTSKNQRKPNVVRGLFGDVVDSPRITGTRRYLFADPAIAPVLEVAFLDGMQEPTIEMEQGFTVDGTSYKVSLDYGIAGVGYQGAVTDAGA